MDNIVPMVPSTPPPLDDIPDDDDEWHKEDFGSFVSPKSTYQKDDSSNWADFSSPPKSENKEKKTEQVKDPEPLRFKAPSVSEEECDLTDDVVYSTHGFDSVVEEVDKFPKSSSNSSLGSEIKVNTGKLATDEENLEKLESKESEPIAMSQNETPKKEDNLVQNDLVPEREIEPKEETSEKNSIDNNKLEEKPEPIDEGELSSKNADTQKDLIPEREIELKEETSEKESRGNNKHEEKSESLGDSELSSKNSESELSREIAIQREEDNGDVIVCVSATETKQKDESEENNALCEKEDDDFADFQSTDVVNNVLENAVCAPSSETKDNENDEDTNFADFQSSTAEISDANNKTENSNCILGNEEKSKDSDFDEFQSHSADLKNIAKTSEEKADETKENENDFANFQSSNESTSRENYANESDNFADFKQFQSDEDNFANFQGSTQDEDDDWAFQGSEQSTMVQGNQENDFAAFKTSTEDPTDLSKVEVKSLLDMCFKKEWLPTKSEEPLDILQYAKEHTVKTEEHNKSPSELRVTPLAGQSSAKSSKREIDISFWNNLTHLEETLALQYSWTKSGVYQFLLKAINIDTRNILTGNKSLPIYASHLGTPLEPMRQGEAKVTTPSLEIVDTSSLSTITPSDNVPPAQFDWSTSGLKNPLASMEDEILDSIGPEVKKNQTLQPLEEILSLKNFRPTAPNVHRTENLSSSARSIVTRIPDISFMRSHMLMFPLKTAHSN